MAQLAQVLVEASPRDRASARAASISRSLTDCGSTPFWAYSSITRYPSKAAFYRSLHFPLPSLWGGGCQVGCGGGRLVLRAERFSDHVALAAGTRADRRHLAPPVLHPAYPAHLAALLLRGCAWASCWPIPLPGQSLPWYYVAGYLLFVGNWVQCRLRPSGVRSALPCGRSRSRSSST